VEFSKMIRACALALTTALVAVFLCVPASAAQQCAPTGLLAEALAETGERVVWRGIAGGSFLILLMQHPTSQAWTIVGTSPRGISCIITHGTDAEITARAQDAQQRREK
jgi:hypothetical protein